MNQHEMPPVFSAELRSALVDRIDAEMAPAARRRRALWTGLAILGGLGILGGAGAATAAILTQPGGTEVAAVAGSVTAIHTGTATVELGQAPQGATNIRMSLVCLSDGSFTFPDGASVSCSATDVMRPERNRTSGYSIPLKANQHSVTITASPGATWNLTATYTNEKVTPWATNANGDSYGVINDNGTPELIAVIATNEKEGYVYATDLAHADGSDQNFTSPDQALEWQRDRAGKTVTITVYLSDGTTPIGKFEVGG
ncbi:MAG: hypothetical protein JWO01_899 [Microbacteriaceae bacterium]|nr:hypothetical protein [Microbacteriaceae bacterium]